MSTLIEDAVAYARANKLRVIGSFWLVGVASAFAMQSRGVSGARRATSVKLIHSRIYAQAATLSALALVAASDAFGGDAEVKEER